MYSSKKSLLLMWIHTLTMMHMMWGIESVVVANGGSTANGDGLQSSSDLMKHKLSVFISPFPNNPQNIMVKRIEETLNLTCSLGYNDTDDDNRSHSAEFGIDESYKLSWYLPMSPQNSKHRTNIVHMRNALTLIVSNLKESDSGDYTCEARTFMENNSDLLSNSVKVTIKPKKNSCSDVSFPCPTGECIPKRFLCDGRQDCKEGADENPSMCGEDPCEGKLQCDDGRCISKHFCCERQEPNCTTRIIPACCKQLLVVFTNMEHNQFPPHSQQFSDMGFLQTTIYTVIGCAMAFMFIITIMVIAICRVHLKRSNLPHYPHHLPTSGQRQDSWGNIFLHAAGGNLPYTSTASGLLVTYNINNGVQFVGRPVNPPPYSEIVRAPPREGPPPPYASDENIASASISSTVPSSVTPVNNSAPAGFPQSTQSNQNNTRPQQPRARTVYTLEDDPEVSASLEPLLSENNNGDINGNSTSEVQVEPNSNLRVTSADEPPNNSNISDCQI